MRSELSKEEFRDRGGRENSKDRGPPWKEYLFLPPGFIGLKLRHRRHLTARKQSTWHV